MIDESTAFSYLIGLGLGIGYGFLKWRWPELWRRFQVWRQARAERRPKIAAEIARIEGAFRLETVVPNCAAPLTFGERIRDRWDRFWSVTEVRTPEQVAQWVYEEAIGLR